MLFDRFSCFLMDCLPLFRWEWIELTLGSTENIIVGSEVWVEDPQLAWLDGKVSKITGQDAEIETSNGKKVTAKLSKIYPKDMEAPAGGVDDMTKLSYLHEPGVLENLKTRYELNEIYTYTGNILIAINPFQRLPHLYDGHMMQQYKGAPFGELSPHVFAVADVAYRAMINERKSNSILVSGESGAGKTETTKMLMRYLAFLGGRAATEGRTVEQQVLEEVEKYKLGSPKSFHYLNQTNCFELAGVSDAHDYLSTRRAMDIVGISAKEQVSFQRSMLLTAASQAVSYPLSLSQEAIFRVVAAVLHIGNIDFSKGKEVDSSVPKDDQAKFHLNTTAELLMCDPVALEDALCKRVMITPEEVIKRSLDPQSAVTSRDGLAKTIYSRLFDWFHDNFQHVFKMEQEEYTKEQIDWSYIEFVDNQDVLDLLEKGVLEAIRISMAGYPTRRPFFEFINRFGLLAPEALEGSYDEKTVCKKILEKKGLKGFQIGKTKVFLRAGQMAELDARRAEVLNNAAKTIQGRIRTHYARKQFIALRKATIVVQSLWRGRLACKVYERIKREAAARKIQKHIRRYAARTAYKKLHISALLLQTGLRAMVARKEFRFRKRTKAATIIQARWHCHKAASYYKRLQRSAIVTQTGWRCRVARRELRLLKMAARDTGALREAKDKLEKHVEELTWRLQLEKRLRTDLEEAKAQEVVKFQNSLEEMKNKIEEANALIIKEREAAKKAIDDAPPVIKETQVLVEDTKKIDSLTEEVENLKTTLDSEKQRADDTEKKYSEVKEISEERRKKLEETEKKVQQLQESLQRLEEKLTNLESENKVLRQQALSMTPNKYLSGRSRSIMQRAESHIPVDAARASLDMQSPSMNHREPSEVDDKPQKSLNEKQQENQELLIRCVAQHLGFSGNRPIAACIIYKCLLQWRSFEVERTSVFDRIIQTIGHAIETQDNNDVLAYWLSNASTLLLLLQRTLKASGAAGMAPQRRRSSSATLFGRMTQACFFRVIFFQSFRGAPQGVNLSLINGGINGGVDALRQVEAKYPALLFKQQLTAYVEKIYGMIRDNLKKEISPLLGLCIQAPRTSRASLVKGARSVANAAAQQALIAHWQGIVKSLGSFLNTLKSNHVPPFLVRKVFTQIFSFINVQLFNSLLLRRECCSFSNGEYVKAGLAELEHWCYKATDEYAGSAWDELKHIRQAIGFLVIHQKPKKTLDEISHDLCPVLSIQQLYRISTMYWDDKYGTHSVSTDVISNMRVLMTEDSNNAVSNSFLLDDDSSIPFSVDDLSKSMEQIDIADIEPPPLIRENSGFSFLLPRCD
ncbi:hypothetical protein Peur_027687 [Populus x canadensis]